MRIIDKQVDYWDHSGLAFGIDKTIVFVRTPRFASLKDADSSLKKFRPWQWENKEMHEIARKSRYKNRPYGSSVHIVIGGKLFRVYWNPLQKKFLDEIEEYRHFLWSKKEDWLSLEGDYRYVNDFYDSPIVTFGVRVVHSYTDNYEPIESIINGVEFDDTSIVIGGAILRHIGLHQFVEPLEIWTLVENWMTSKTNEMPVFSNDDKIAAAGFDNKISFRGK